MKIRNCATCGKSCKKYRIYLAIPKKYFCCQDCYNKYKDGKK